MSLQEWVKKKKKKSPRDTIYGLKTPKAENNQPSATVLPQVSLQSALPAGKSNHHRLFFKQAANKLASAASQLAPWLPSSHEKKARPGQSIPQQPGLPTVLHT